MEILLVPLVVGLRLVSPFFFFVLHPFAAIMSDMALDSADYYGLGALDGITFQAYHLIEKPLDLLNYLGALMFFVLFLRELWYSKFVIPLLIYRIVGNLLFFVTRDRLVFLFFPNWFTPILFIYSFFDIVKRSDWLRNAVWFQIAVWLVVIPFTVFTEILKHNTEDAPLPDETPDTKVIIHLLLVLFVAIILGRRTFPAFKPGTVQRGWFGLFQPTTTRRDT